MPAIIDELLITDSNCSDKIDQTKDAISSYPIINGKEIKLAKKYSKDKIVFDNPALKTVFGEVHTTKCRRLWYSILIFLISTYIMCIANIYTERRWVEVKMKPNVITLPDLGFSLVENYLPFLALDIMKPVPDILNVVVVVIGFIWLYIEPKRMRLTILRRILVINAILYIGRAFCVIFTLLPSPYTGYENRPKHYWFQQNIFYQSIFVLLRIEVTSTDLFYSGHTVSMTLIFLAIKTYSHCSWLKKSIALLILFALISIIGVKFHYTIDVVIALILTTLVWTMYHLALEIKHIRDNTFIFNMLEGDIELQEGYLDWLSDKLKLKLL